MANETRKSTGHRGVEIHGNSIRVVFSYKRVRHRHTLGIEPTKPNMRYAAALRTAALFALKSGKYNAADFFPHSRSACVRPERSNRLGDLCARYMPLKATDITPESELRYGSALDVCLDTIGRRRFVDTLLPLDIQQLRVDLIATRAVSTVNHYLTTFAGFLSWCETNRYCIELARHCVRFAHTNKDPDPLTFEEYRAILDKGCLHPIDRSTVTAAVYTGLRPGELLALAVEDVAPDFKSILVRRSITASSTFKVPKSKMERLVLLLPPAREALEALVADAEGRDLKDVQVWLNRHESRTDRVRILLSPKTLARKKVVNDYFVPTAWCTKWTTLVRRAQVRSRQPYQTRHTYACWSLTARANLAFIAGQMGHADYSMLVKVYARWIQSESARELERIWDAMQSMTSVTSHHAPRAALPHSPQTAL